VLATSTTDTGTCFGEDPGQDVVVGGSVARRLFSYTCGLSWRRASVDQSRKSRRWRARRPWPVRRMQQTRWWEGAGGYGQLNAADGGKLLRRWLRLERSDSKDVVVRMISVANFCLA
jgi:hypothetical protein